MQRTDVLTATAMGLILLALSTAVALAKENESGGAGEQRGVTATMPVPGLPANVDEQSQDQRGDGTDEDGKDNQGDQPDATSAASSSGQDQNDDGGKGEGEKHRSRVANILQSLLDLADEDHGIGDDVREVAHEQASSSEEAAKAMDEVAARSALMTFLFGTDYKNIGVLRSTLKTTQNHIDRLTKAKEKVASAEVKAGIDAQIAALEKANADAEVFVKAHEDAFSLFGWFAKLFQ
jgi:hypothetical protein